MAEDDYLLHPGLVRLVPFGAALTANPLKKRISETLFDDLSADPDVSVVVRSFNEAEKLEQLLTDVHNQVFDARVEIVVVDNGSSDRSPQVARDHGAVVVTLPQSQFSYPRSLNLGMEAASHDVVFVTVAHTRLSNIYTLHAGARHFSRNDNTAGAFGTCLPNDGASYFERLSAMGDPTLSLRRPAQRITKCGMGALGATGAMLSKTVWQELGGFDLRYQAGGEDTALANSMLANGYVVVQEPALTVHHSHGLGLRNSVKQYRHQLQILKSPQQFDRQALLKRRPDLQANETTAEYEH